MKIAVLTASFAALAAATAASKRFITGNCMYPDGHEIREPKSRKIFAIECGISHFGGLLSSEPNTTINATTLDICISACGQLESCILAEWNTTSTRCELKSAYGVPELQSEITAARLEIKSPVPGSNSSTSQKETAPPPAPRSSAAAKSTFWFTLTSLRTITHVRTLTIMPTSSLIALPVANTSQPPTVFTTVTVTQSYSKPAPSDTSSKGAHNVSSSSQPGGPGASLSKPAPASTSSFSASKPVSSAIAPTSSSNSSKPATIVVASISSAARLSSTTVTSAASSVSLPQGQPSNTTSLFPVSSAQPVASPLQGKRGLLYNDAKFMKNFGGPGSKVTWSSNWHSDRYMNNEGVHVSLGHYNDALEFVPQLWSPAHGGYFDTQMDTAANSKTSASSIANVLAFNEPNQCGDGTGGSCMSNQTQVLVDAYRKHLQPQGKTARLGSPSVTNGPDGIDWLKEFMAMCSGCKIDFVQAHWYGGGMSDFKPYIETFYKAFNKPIWLTEFGLDKANSSPQKDIAFLKEAMKYLDATGYVERYAFFMAKPNGEAWALVNADGSLTEIGKLYNSG